MLKYLAVAALLAGSAASAETLTGSLTTPQGTLSATRNVTGAHETRLMNAIAAYAQRNGLPAPTPAQAFDFLFDRWVGGIVAFVQEQEQIEAAAGVAPIGVTK